MRIEYGKVIKPGQLVTVNNIVYRCKKADCDESCMECDLQGICMSIPFTCDWNSNFKRIRRKRYQKPN